MAFAPDTWPRQFRDLIRLSNKYLLNPLMLRLAGTRYLYASTIRHGSSVRQAVRHSGGCRPGR